MADGRDLFDSPVHEFRMKGAEWRKARIREISRATVALGERYQQCVCLHCYMAAGDRKRARLERKMAQLMEEIKENGRTIDLMLDIRNGEKAQKSILKKEEVERAFGQLQVLYLSPSQQ